MPSILLAVKHALLDEHNARLIVQIARDTATSDTPIRSAKGQTPAGDERKLRGIPVLARGCGSAIPGTQPLNALMAKQRNVRTDVLEGR